MIFTLTGQKKLWLFTIYQVNLQSGPAVAQAEKSANDAGTKTAGAKTATAKEEEKQPQRKTATAVKCKKGKSRREGKNKKKVIR